MSITSVETPMLIDDVDVNRIKKDLVLRNVEVSGNIFKNSETMIELR